MFEFFLRQPRAEHFGRPQTQGSHHLGVKNHRLLLTLHGEDKHFLQPRALQRIWTAEIIA